MAEMDSKKKGDLPQSSIVATSPLEEVWSKMDSRPEGLTENEVVKRREKYGANHLKEGKKSAPWKIFFRQFQSFIVYILVVAVIISLAMGEPIDAAVIFAILLLNGILGFVQEYRAEKSLEALRKMASPMARVVREGKVKEIEAEEVVPGDVLVLESGDRVPADGRLFHTVGLKTQEALLTGESLAVEKKTEAVAESSSLGEQKNMVFSATVVTEGRGKAVVTRTGMATEMGKIAQLMEETEDEETPLQEKLSRLGEWLGGLTLVICALVVTGGLLQGGDLFTWLLLGVSLAVAAIPEGLPAIVTISLALGVQRMAEKNALIRRLPSVETLGSTTVICTDKTGTLTKNEMTVTRLYTQGKIYEVTGSGYSREGRFLRDSQEVDPGELEWVLKIGALCNDALFEGEKLMGDPTEGALLISGAKGGFSREKMEEEMPRQEEVPFTSERKFMSTLHRSEEGHYLLGKGAPEEVLRRSNRYLIDGEIQELTEEKKEEIRQVARDFASEALRVLAFAYRQSETTEEKEFVFAGLQGMIDPPREEARQSVEKCHRAGIKVIMITGDFEVTARAIAEKIGLEGKVMTGREMREGEEWKKEVEEISVFARVNPEDKIEIVEVLKEKGHVVAMTGDGVNDAPALKRADIGISMGKSGTDVAREASEMILTDDNFASIVRAVEEGRGIYDNIKKFVTYLLSCNIGEVLTLFVAMLIGFQYGGKLVLPLVAIQILWINIVTDGLPALALGLDPTDPQAMERRPRSPEEAILTSRTLASIFAIGVMITLGVLYLFNHYLPQGPPVAQTVAFTSLVFLQIVNVYLVRLKYRVPLFANLYLWAAVAMTVVLQALVIYTPIRHVFDALPLGWDPWLHMVAVAAFFTVLGTLGVWILSKMEGEDKLVNQTPDSMGSTSNEG